MIFSVTTAVLELSCYLLGIIVGSYFFKIVDLTKIVRIKNNREYYFVYFISTCLVGFILGQFLFRLITMFL